MLVIIAGLVLLLSLSGVASWVLPLGAMLIGVRPLILEP